MRQQHIGIEVGLQTRTGPALADHHRGLERGQRHAFESGRQIGMHDRKLRIGVVDHMREHRALVGGVDRHEDRAEVIAREEHPQMLATVGQPDQDMVALRHAELLQSDRGLDHHRSKVAIGPLLAVIAELDIDLVGALALEAVHEVTGDDTVAGRHARVGGRGALRAGQHLEG